MKHLAYAAVLGVLASQAMAGGPVVVIDEEPVAVAAPTPDYDWTGFYIGLGATSGNIGIDDAELDTSGFAVQAGYLRDLGTFVVGGELQYSDADIDDTEASITSTRAKLLGGYDAGRFLPYVFVGLSDIEISGDGDSVSDTTTNYGLGGRYAFGAEGNFVAGLEYLMEDTDDFDASGTDVDRDEVSLRFDYRF
jgi:outer membrane immunogenic protein